MIDPLDSLAFTVHANKGVYALLLGSGVSKAAGVPTGWEVTLDLIHKWAKQRGEDCGPDPVAWYREHADDEPEYSRLLQDLFRSQVERQGCLRQYFEPTDEEREEGLKVPTKAHRSIATLMAGGFVRVVLTTNFDRLLETALQDKGIQPAVISTNAAAQGAVPLVHQEHLIVKLHGDYLEPRLRNTEAELAFYPRDLKRLLARILDQFGLIVCGWSGEWDKALHNAILATRNHRFAAYWTEFAPPADAALRLIEQRGMHRIPITGADPFFEELAERVSSLEEFSRPHPLSTEMAVARLKRYLVEERHRIRLFDPGEGGDRAGILGALRPTTIGHWSARPHEGELS